MGGVHLSVQRYIKRLWVASRLEIVLNRWGATSMIRGPLGRGCGGRQWLEGHRQRSRLSLKFLVKRCLTRCWGYSHRWGFCRHGWCLFSRIKIALFSMRGCITCGTWCRENTRGCCTVRIEQGHSWQRGWWGTRRSSWDFLHCQWLWRQP